MAGTVWSCLSDGSEKYERQALIWLKTLRGAARRREHAVIHSFAPSRELVVAAARFGAEVVQVDRAQPASSPSNKLVQLTSPVLARASRVILCDCDIAFCGDVDEVVSGHGIRAKRVDLANPPLAVWRALFARAGLLGEVRAAEPTHDSVPTYANNLNGGLYVLPQAAFEALGEAWPRWNAWVLGCTALLGRWAYHVSQISFGLAVEELGLGVQPLGTELNFPTHLDYSDRPDADVVPRALHYHRLDRRGRLTQTGLPGVDSAIDSVNTFLDALESRRPSQ